MNVSITLESFELGAAERYLCIEALRGCPVEKRLEAIL